MARPSAGSFPSPMCFLAGLVSLALMGAGGAQAGTPVRVATWNIAAVGAPLSPEYNASLAILNRIGADIVAINGVDGSADSTNLLALAADAGYPYVNVAATSPFGSLRNAFVSVYPVIQSTIHTSTSLSGDPPANDMTRQILSIRIDVPNVVRDLSIVTQHWKSGTGDDSEFRRAVESHRVAQAVESASMAGDAVIVMGDVEEEITTVPQSPNPFTSEPPGLPAGYSLGSDLFTMLSVGIENDPFHNLLASTTTVTLEPHPALQLDGSEATRPASGRRLDYIFLSTIIDGTLQGEVYDSADEGLAGGLPKFGGPLPPNASADASDHLLVFADIAVDDGAPPIVDPIPDQTVLEGGSVVVTATATDADGDPLTFSSTPSLSWITQTPSTSEFTIAPGFDVAGPDGASFPVTIEASDGLNVGSATFTVHVVDVATAANTPYAARTWPGVSAATGELSFSAGPDLCLGGPRPLCYGRYYGSLLDRVGAAGTQGANWLGTYDWSYVETRSEATVTDPRGRIYRFASVGGGAWSLVEPQDAPYQLTELGTEMSFTHARHRAFYIIDRSTARLARIEDGRGNVHTLSYVGGNLSTVSDGLGRTLTFTHDGSNRVTSVTDGTRTVTYGYTGPNLTSVTDPEGKTTTYLYDTGHAVQGLLTAMVDASGGNPVQYTYGSDGHVGQVHLGGGNDITHQRTIVSTTQLQTDIQFPDLGVHRLTHESGRLASYVSPQLDVTLYAYDGQGRPTSVTRPSTIVPVTVDYDPVSGFPSTLTLPDATQWQISYVDRPLITGRVYFTSSIQAPDLGVVNYTHDTVGNLTQVTDQANQSWTMTYNAFGEPLTITNPTSGVTTNTYDSAGRLLSVNDGAGTTQFMYDALDRVTTVTNPDASTTTLSWNGRDQLLSVTNELSKTWTYAYRDNGQLLSVADPLLATTTFGYDTRNRLSQMIDPEGGIQLWAYDPSWRLASVTDPTLRAVTYQYDLLGRLTGITDPAGKTTTLGYDVDGRLTSVTDPLTHTWSYGYNSRDQLSSATDPLLNTTNYAYDDVGRVTAINRPLGLNSTFSYDLRGLPTTATTGPVSVGYSYTTLGLLDTYTDGNGNAWTHGYDAQGRLTSATDPLLRSATYSYDSRNRLTGVVHQEGSATFSYDVASHLTLRSYSDGTSHGYTYDDVGRLLTTEGVTRTYDGNGRITEENGLTYTYDDAGRLLTETYAPSQVITHGYDARGLLSQTTDYLAGATTFAYDDAGRLTQLTRPNGTAASYAYDAADRLLSLAETNATDSLGFVELTRDALGRVTSTDRRMPLSWPLPSTTRTFAYDAASQVMGFSYDGLGRLLDDGTRTYAWDGASRADSVNQGATAIRYASDGLDRVIQRTLPGSPSLDLIYSPRSSEDAGVTFGDGIRGRRPAAGAGVVRPYSSFGGHGSEADDGFYRRVSERLRHKNRAISLFDYERLVLESVPGVYKIRCLNGCKAAVGTGTATPSVIREGGANDRTHRVSTPDGRPLHSINLGGPSPSPQYYHFDEAGNTAFLTNAGGAVIASYAYSPSGEANAIGELQHYPALTYKGQYGVVEEAPSGLYRAGDLLYDALTTQSSPTRGSCGCKEKFVRSKPHVAPLPSPSGTMSLAGPGTGVPTPALFPDDRPEKLELGGTGHDSKSYGFRVTQSSGPAPESHPQEVLDLVAAATGSSSSQANRRYLYFPKVADVEGSSPFFASVADAEGSSGTFTKGIKFPIENGIQLVPGVFQLDVLGQRFDRSRRPAVRPFSFSGDPALWLYGLNACLQAPFRAGSCRSRHIRGGSGLYQETPLE